MWAEKRPLQEAGFGCRLQAGARGRVQGPGPDAAGPGHCIPGRSQSPEAVAVVPSLLIAADVGCNPPAVDNFVVAAVVRQSQVQRSAHDWSGRS